MGQRIVVACSIAALAFGTVGCATKGYVNTSVAEVNGKVDSLGRSVEETQERTRQNEGRITQVDQKADAAAQSATQAAGAAREANQAAANAAATANAAGARADAIDKSMRRLVYEVVLSEEQGQFKFGQAALPDDAKTKLAEIIEGMKEDPMGAYFEIEGHTDDVGPKELNERLGMERAEAVKRYLYEQHQIPLHKMNVISYGEDKPVAPNNTRDGRAQNRRVVIRILA
jgi:outer membrane protein OmpA-like peptidoglycan-associated protein